MDQDTLPHESAGESEPRPFAAESADPEPPPLDPELPAADSGPGPDSAVLAEVNRRLEQLEELVRASQHKDEQIARLHAELQQFRSGEAERRFDPLLQGIIRLQDHIGRTVAAFREKSPEELSAEKVLKQLAGVEEDIELLLAQHEVSPFREESETLIPQRQLAIRVETTEDPAAVGRIAARVRPGFMFRERILVKERVAVFALPKKAG